MEKYCRYCGKPIKNSAYFCPSCGAQIESLTPLSTNQQADIKQSKTSSGLQKTDGVKQQSHFPQKAYRRPVLFRVVALILIVILTVSAVKKLLPRDDFVITPTEIPTYTSSDSNESNISNAAVTPENPIAVFGSISVDMGKWNLSGNDEVIIEQLPEKTDASATVTYRGYDFKLKSGQSQFTTSALITLPVTTNSDEEGSVVFFNENSSEWEYIAYDLSEDEKSYVVYMSHFSTIAEKKVKKYVGTENDIRSVSGDMQAEGSLYQYGSFTTPTGEFIPLNERSVYMGDDSFRRLYLSIDTEELKNILTVAKLPTEDAVAFALGTLNNAQSIADCTILLKGLEKSLSPAGRIRLSGCMGGFGAALTAGRIAYQANHGGSFSQILWENKSNIAESLFGALAFGAEYVGAAGAASVFSVAAAIVFAGSLASGYVESVTQYSSYEETVYQFFLDKGKSKIDMTELTNYDFMDKLYPDGRNFEKVLKAIYERYANEPKELDAAVSRMYYGYAGYFWKYLSAEEREEFARKEYAGDVIAGITKWTEPSEQEKQQYIEKTVARLASETEPMLRALAYDALAKMKQELRKTLTFQVEPYLNRMITFVVKDKILKDGEYFSSSLYAGYDIRFKDKTAPQFTVKYVDISTYTEDKYTPAARDESDIIYKCTMYHYIQMGCPTSIIFEGNPDSDLPAQTVSFTIDDSGSGDIIVNLELEPVESNTFWLGTWTHNNTYQSVVMPGSGEVPETIPYKYVMEITPYNKDGYEFKIVTTYTEGSGSEMKSNVYETWGNQDPGNSNQLLVYYAFNNEVFTKIDQSTIKAGTAEYKR